MGSQHGQLGMKGCPTGTAGAGRRPRDLSEPPLGVSTPDRAGEEKWQGAEEESPSLEHWRGPQRGSKMALLPEPPCVLSEPWLNPVFYFLFSGALTSGPCRAWRDCPSQG